MIRAYKRSMAKANMAKAGGKRINRGFAYTWRKWLEMPKAEAKKIERKERKQMTRRMSERFVSALTGTMMEAINA